jgi:hypothetical protein
MPAYDPSIRQFDVNEGVNKKKCRMCQVFKTTDNFYYHPFNSDRLSSLCRECQRADAKRRYAANPTPTKQRSRNRDLVLRRNPRHRLSRMLERIRQLKDMPCDLTLDYLHGLYNSQKGLCSFTHRVMTLGEAENGMADINAMSVDRLEPKLGYVKGNVRLITIQANVAKGRWSITDLMEFCNDLLRALENSSDTWGVPPKDVVDCHDVIRVSVKAMKLLEVEIPIVADAIPSSEDLL